MQDAKPGIEDFEYAMQDRLVGFFFLFSDLSLNGYEEKGCRAGASARPACL